MKKAVGLLIAMYCFLLVPTVVLDLIYKYSPLSGEAVRGAQGAVFAASLIFLLIAGILNVRSSIKLYRSGEYNALRGEMKTAKFGSIPFFLAEFVILIAIAAGAAVISLFFFWTIGGPIAMMVLSFLAFLIIYIILLMSSTYNIAFLCLLKKEGLLNIALMIILILLCCAPVVDVIVTIILLSMHKKRVS